MLASHVDAIYRVHQTGPANGDAIYRVNSDTSFISTLLWSNFRHLIVAMLTFAAMLWIVLELDWVLAVLALAVGPMQYVSVILYNKLFKEKSKKMREMQSTAQSMMQQILSPSVEYSEETNLRAQMLGIGGNRA